MKKEVYFNKITKFLPNNPIDNEVMEEYLGLIKGEKSRSKNIILRNNGIKKRYYALDKNGISTHSNAELTAEAIKLLYDKDFNQDDIELLACGTTSPDQNIPSHASMVQGLIGGKTYEAISPTGACNASMYALKYAYMSILSENTVNSVVTGSEKLSSWMLSKNFEEEVDKLEALGKKPYVAFDRDFLRWMLSDGAAAALITDKPNTTGISLKIDWIDITSHANEYETCMYSGGIKNSDGSLTPWRDVNPEKRNENSIFALHQDVKTLESNIIRLGGLSMIKSMEKHNYSISDIDYYMPHLSSEFFRKKLSDEAEKLGHPIPKEKWFTNLTSIGNVGAASAFLMLEEIFNSKKLKPGQKLLLMIPESARFSYTYAMFTVV